MDDIAIRVRNISKRYPVYDSERARLAHVLWPRRANGAREIVALDDVSFEVKRGESFGVIGRNGGGKSTLLQILTGVLRPTSGEVQVNGRVSALLELGSGFNPEYTGRDNVILNGMLLGLTREQMLARFDEIAAFAEIGEAMDRPVKTYSSGMVVRLAYAVQALIDPEILVIDEALSVGDFFFQQKCFGHLRKLLDRGVTLVFVSHDMAVVRNLCREAVYLRRGSIGYLGDSKTAVRHYLAETSAAPAVAAGAGVAVPGSGPALRIPDTALWQRPVSAARGPLLAVELLDARGEPASTLRMGETARLRVYFHTADDASGHVAVVIKNRYDQVVTNVGSYGCGLAPLSSRGSAFAILELEIDMRLEAGLYSVNVAFARPVEKNTGEVLDETGWIGPLRIDWDYEREVAPFLGMFGLPVRSEVLHGPVLSEAPAAD